MTIKKTKFTWASVVLIVTVITAFLLVHYIPGKPKVIGPTPINTNRGAQAEKLPVTSQTTGLPSSDSTTKQQPPNGQSQASLVPPSGSFVSNHKPNLGNSPAPNTEESTCNVPQGATCNITFNLNGTSLSLGKQTAGASGVVAWQWSLQGLGLTVGDWKVAALATLGSQTATTSDPLTLEVAE
jgi:hypothetical protein